MLKNKPTKSSYSITGDCVEAWAKSSYSSGNGACVQWNKSSYSADTANCVERGVDGGDRTLVHVRDSKDPDGPVLTFRVGAWTEFIEAIKRGELVA